MFGGLGDGGSPCFTLQEGINFIYFTIHLILGVLGDLYVSKRSIGDMTWFNNEKA